MYSAIIAYCLVAIVERKMKLNMEMYDLLSKSYAEKELESGKEMLQNSIMLIIIS